MGKYLSFGGRNKYYIYIFLSIVLKILSDFIYGSKHPIFYDLRIDLTDTQTYLFIHKLIHQIYCYVGILIFSLVFYYKEKGLNSKKKKNNSTKIYIFSLFITFIWIIKDLLIEIFDSSLKGLDFWMLELLIMYYFNSKIFGVNQIKLYKHHILSFMLNIFPCILKIIVICALDILGSSENKKNIYLKYKWLIAVGIIFYLIIYSFDSFIILSLRWLIDKKNISPNKLLISYSIFGTIIFSIISIISTYINCNNKYLCQIIDNNNNYKENLSLYFSSFIKDDVSLAKEITIEILVNLIGSLLIYFYEYSSMNIIKYLSTFHMIFLTPVIYFIHKIFLLIRTKIAKGKYLYFDQDDNENDKTFKYIKLYLDISGDLFSIFGFIIFIEIIQLNFCGYNYNTREAISERADKELELLEDKHPIDFLIYEDGDVDEIKIDKTKT